ncbi:NAD-dependent epimerase/dehydratase family protein [Anaplasmataceae bacterium AB001_6]|nr:NAD-dependent epimerase/dehydratase family protein [Anaplasmataceae bacterium AB001_6]
MNGVNKKVVVVFGGSGFVGRYLVEMLVSAGYVVKICSRNPDLLSELSVSAIPGQILFLKYNPENIASIAACIGVGEIVVNLVGASYSCTLSESRAINVDIAANIAHAALEKEASHMLHFSTLMEDASKKNYYVKTKLESEDILNGIISNLTIIKSSFIYGKRDHFITYFSRFINSFYLLPWIGAGKAKIQPIHVTDVVTSVIKIIDSKMYGTFQLAGPVVYSLKDILDFVIEYSRPKRNRFVIRLPSFLCTIVAYPLELKVSRLLSKFFLGNFEPIITRQHIAIFKQSNIISTSNLIKNLAIKTKIFDNTAKDVLNG